MHQKASNKFCAMELHDAELIFTVIFITERYLFIFYTDKALIADCNTMTIASQLSNNTICVVEAMFAIHHPVFLHELFKHTIDLINSGNTM